MKLNKKFINPLKNKANIVDFVENKKLNKTFFDQLLEISDENNQWANNGPLWWMLKHNFCTHLNLNNNLTVVPCANGGIALEILMSINESIINKPLKWALSSFSFSNLGVGRTANSLILDCDEKGLISIEELERANRSYFRKFQGIILTNPFGLHNNFEDHIAWAEKNGKVLIIDNAAGLRPDINQYKFQSFSLHHTKPYGFGEGGLAIIPKKYEKLALSFIEYGNIELKNKQFWINNGKLSDLSSAAILSRLNDFENWYFQYQNQALRIDSLAIEARLRPLHSNVNPTPSMSRIYLSKKSINIKSLNKNSPIPFGKYYKPLANTKNSQQIYKNAVNVPTHPDMSKISDSVIVNTLKNIQV